MFVESLSWSQCDEPDCVVVVAVVAAPDELESLPPAAIATPAPPRAMAVTAVARRAVCFGRNTENLLSVVVSRPMESRGRKNEPRWA